MIPGIAIEDEASRSNNFASFGVAKLRCVDHAVITAMNTAIAGAIVTTIIVLNMAGKKRESSNKFIY